MNKKKTNLYQGFFKENVRYLVWTSSDRIILILGTRFSLILGTLIGSLKTLTLGRSAKKGDFRKKNSETHMALHGNYSALVRVTDLVEVSKDAASLLECIGKKFFAWGVQIFCE